VRSFLVLSKVSLAKILLHLILPYARGQFDQLEVELPATATTKIIHEPVLNTQIAENRRTGYFHRLQLLSRHGRICTQRVITHPIRRFLSEDMASCTGLEIQENWTYNDLKQL
jgi:hypothetical protein